MARAKKDSEGNGATAVADEGAEGGEDMVLGVSNAKMLTVILEGVTPLMMDAFSPEKIEKVLIRKQKEPPVTDQPLDKMCEEKIYRDDNGNIVIMGSMLWACLVKAGQLIKFDGKRMISNAKGTNLSLILTPMDEYYMLASSVEELKGKVADPSRKIDPPKWTPDIKRGVLPANSITNGIVRPKFKSWAIMAHFLFDIGLAPHITEATVRNLFMIAGRGSGLGSFRPSCKGMYGIFRLASWETKDAEG